VADLIIRVVWDHIVEDVLDFLYQLYSIVAQCLSNLEVYILHEWLWVTLQNPRYVLADFGRREIFDFGCLIILNCLGWSKLRENGIGIRGPATNTTLISNGQMLLKEWIVCCCKSVEACYWHMTLLKLPSFSCVLIRFELSHRWALVPVSILITDHQLIEHMINWRLGNGVAHVFHIGLFDAACIH